MLDILDSNILQINVPAILIANGIGTWLMLMILLSRRKRFKMLSLDGKIFYWMCRLCLTLCVLETFGYLWDGKNFLGARQLLMGINVLILGMGGLLAYLWVCCVDYKLFEDRRRLRKIYPFIAIPGGIICLLAAGNLFVDVFFALDQDNSYQRQPLLLLAYAVAYGYMTYGAVLACYYRKRLDKYLFMPVIAFLMPIYLGSAIQLCSYGISLIWPSTALSLTLLYLNLQSEESFLDPLTNLYNRNYLLHYMAHISKKSKKGKQITGIMLDVNNFKHINDTYGHIAGDGVLQAVGKLLIRATNRDTVVVRYGGDEFVIILEGARREEAEHVKESIQKEVDAQNASSDIQIPISLSMGVAEFEKLDVYQFFQDMDRSMYHDKRSYYVCKGNDGLSVWEISDRRIM